LKEFFVQLLNALPSLRNKFAVTGVIVAVAGYIATRAVDPSAIQAQISIAALGIIFLVFGLAFHAIESFPAQKRSSLILSLFVLFSLLVLALIGATGYFLIQARAAERSAFTPPNAFDTRSDISPIAANRLQHDNLPASLITAEILQANEGRLILQFVGLHRAGYPTRSEGSSSWVSHAGKKGIEFQTAGFAWAHDEALGRFALVSHTGGPYVVEAVYLKLHRFAECSLRDEETEVQGPGLLPAYALYVSSKHNVYELVPRVDLGSVGVWRLRGQDQDEFSLSLQYPPYTLFVVSLMAEVRDESTGDAFRLRSAFYPLLRVNGNVGGCLDLSRLYNSSLLRKPEMSSYQSLTDDLLSYQILTVDPNRDRTFLLRVVRDLPLEGLQQIADHLRRAATREPENTVFQSNEHWFSELRRWRRDGSLGDPP
jgi:hypothetical protein